MLPRLLASISSGLLAERRLSIFTYHRVVKAHDSLLPGYPDAARFYEEMSWLKEVFDFLDPEQACDQLYAGTLPARAAVLTLDDGYNENFDVVNPILLELKIPAVYFISTNFLGGKVMFNDRLNEAIRLSSKAEIDLGFMNLGLLPISSIDQKRAALAKVVPLVKYKGLAQREELVCAIEAICQGSRHAVRMMDEDQIRKTASLGITIGAHTRNHPILTLLDDGQSAEEIQGSIDDLESMLGQKPTLFAYPNGRYGDDFEERHCSILSGRVKYAFATGGGVNSKASNRFRLARSSPWGKSKFGFQLRQIKHVFE